MGGGAVALLERGFAPQHVAQIGEMVRMRFRLALAAVLFVGCSQSAQAVLHPQPGVSVSITEPQVEEGGANGAFTAVLKIAPSGDVTVQFSSSEQCSFSTDALTFTPENWNQAQTVTVSAIDDSIIEPTQSCSPEPIRITGPDGYEFATVSSPVFEIVDNDKAALSITNVTDGDETGPQDSVLRVELSDALEKPLVVSLTYAGTATGDGVDYSGPTEVIIPAGEIAVQVNLQVVEDDVPEGVETIVVAATAPEGDAQIEKGTAQSRIVNQKSIDFTDVQAAFASQVSQFVSQRLDFVASHDPRAHRLINRNAGPKVAITSNDASIIGVAISPTAGEPASGELWNIWAEAEFGRVKSNTDFFTGFAGADYLVNDRLAIGLMTEIDQGAGENSRGTGWMTGPYISAEVADQLFLDLRGLWGRSQNTTSQDIDGHYFIGGFGTQRWLVEARLAGTYDLDALRFTPELTAIYGRELQSDFIVSDGENDVAISAQTVGLGRLAAGLNIAYLGKYNEVDVEPFIGAKLNWNFENPAALPQSQNLRGAVTVGLNLRSADNTFSAIASYDGIGSDQFNSISGKLSFSHQF